MYQFFILLQYAGILLLIANIVFILRRQKTRMQSLLLILCITVLINMVGYLFEMQAREQATAIMAVKILYLGKPFALLTMFFVILEYLQIKLPDVVRYALILLHTVISLLVFTCEEQGLFYSSIGYSEEGLFPHLVLGHGPFYWVFMSGTGIYSILMLAFLYREGRRVTDKRQRSQIMLLSLMVFLCAGAVVLFLTGVTMGYDTTALSFTVGTVLLSVALRKYSLLDPVRVAQETIIDQLAEGIVALGEDNTVLLVNETARKLVGEIRKKSPELRENEAIARLCVHGEYHGQERVYEISMDGLNKDEYHLGNLFIIKDITERYNYAQQLKHDVDEKTQNLEKMQHNVTLGLAETIESRDHDTGGHVRRTSDVVGIFAKKLGGPEMHGRFSQEFLKKVASAAPMHDLGKIGVPDEVLNKPGRFTPEEYEKMKTHAQKGAKIIEKILDGIDDKEYMTIAINIAQSHHERWDGTGYPCGLKGEEIPVEARIMALADVFDALVSKRVYKSQMSFDEAFGIIESSLGTHFDAELGRCFISCRKELEEYYLAAESAQAG